MIQKRNIARAFAPLLEPARYKGAFGGRGSGKSHFFGEQLVEDALYHRGLLAVCIREVQKTLAQSSKRLIEHKIRSLGVGKEFRVFKDKIETPGGGLVIFTGMQDRAVNNSARQVLADVRAMANDLIWFQYGRGDGVASHTYASATSTTVSGVDVTVAYHAGRRVKAVGASTGTIFGSVASSSFSANTTITYVWDAGSLSNESLTIYLSQAPVTGAAIAPDAVSNVEGTLGSATTTDLGSVRNSRIGVTGTTTITSFGSGVNLMRCVRFAGGLTLTHNATSLILLGGASRTTAVGDVGMYASDSSGNWREIGYSRASGAAVISTPASTRQILTSGSSATYTTPAGARQLRIRMVGGGGGGGGSGTGDGGNGGNGNDTIFNSVHAKAGSGSTGTANIGGLGGTGGTGSASIRVAGMAGFSGSVASSGSVWPGCGGGATVLGFGGAGAYGSAGPVAASNTGGGGSGAGASSPDVAGGGGGGGEFVEYIINSPSGTYTYTIGSGGNGGSAGTNGNAGGGGGSGIIIVDEYY